MNGNKNALLDTNAIVSLLQGNKNLVELCNGADNFNLLETIYDLRKTTNLKLPDANI